MKSLDLENIKTEVYGPILIIRFDRTNKKNALTIDMYKNLNTILDEASTDKTVKVVVFSSTGQDFSAGNDLKDFQENPPLDQTAPVFKFIKKLTLFDKPMIAAVDGLAVGVGFTMLLHCDFVYVTDKTKLIAPFVNLGLVPEAGSTKLLTELVGKRKASEILMLAEPVSGIEATKLGISNAVIKKELLENKAISVAKILSEKAPIALKITRELMNPNNELLKVVEVEAAHFSSQVQSKECKEAILALTEKRKPKFENNI